MKQVFLRIPQRAYVLLIGLLLSVGAFAQITVNGHVKDGTGEGVIGATVRIVGQDGGTVTDFDGNFTLKCAEGASLQISSVGYQTVTVKAASEVNVVMQDDAALLNEVDRAFTLTKEGEKKPIIMEIKEGDMFLELTSSIGSMYGRVDVKKEGKDQIIGFNPRFFIEALKVIDDEEIDIYFVNSNSPCFICNETGKYIYIILPVNINR